jgi:hypothetical protein
MAEKRISNFFYVRMSNEPMASFGDFGTGKFLYERRSREYRNLKFSMSHERHITIPVQVTIFAHEWLSRRGEKKILQEQRSREWRIFFLPQLLSHS